MYAIKIKTDDKFFIVRLKPNDIFDDKELYSPIYKNYKNITMSVNLIKRNDVEVNKIASNLFNSGIIYGDVYILLDNRENDADSYIGLLSEILKDVAMTTSEVRTLRKYEKIFKAITTDTSSDTSDTDEEPNRYSNSYNDDVILRYRDTDHEQCQELEYCIHT